MKTRKHKRHTSHFESIPTLRNHLRTVWGVTMPDGRKGVMYVHGWLDTDGAFYEMAEGGMGKVQDIDGCRYAYVPLSILRINTFPMRIEFR